MPRTLPAVEAHQERLLARANGSSDAAERFVRRVWARLLDVIRRGGPWPLVYHAANAALAQLPNVAHAVLDDLVKAHRDAATWTAEQLAETVSHRRRTRILRNRGLLEADAASTANLLIDAILPPLDTEAVRRVVYGSGWLQTIQSLTKLAAPESLAAQIAGAVQAGRTVQQIATAIQPFVQGVQTSARRVARTAGLWVAHQAEADVYAGLENDVIAGYTVRAVLDARTRPEHRARDGHQFWCRPTGGQKGLAEMPRPPREKDGSWAFNCRCFLVPILSAEQ